MFRPDVVLVALDPIPDGDESLTRELIATSCDVAIAFRASLVLARVVSPTPLAGSPGADGHGRAKARLDKEWRLARFFGARDASPELLVGTDSADVIAGSAEALGAGLIVTAAPRRGLVARLLRGDVVRQLAARTEAPLLLVPLSPSASVRAAPVFSWRMPAARAARAAAAEGPPLRSRAPLGRPT